MIDNHKTVTFRTHMKAVRTIRLTVGFRIIGSAVMMVSPGIHLYPTQSVHIPVCKVEHWHDSS